MLREYTDRTREQRQAADYRAGVLAAATLNAQGGIQEHKGGPTRTATPYDFFPGLPSAPRRAQTPEEQMALWRSMRADGLPVEITNGKADD